MNTRSPVELVKDLSENHAQLQGYSREMDLVLASRQFELQEAKQKIVDAENTLITTQAGLDTTENDLIIAHDELRIVKSELEKIKRERNVIEQELDKQVTKLIHITAIINDQSLQ